MVVEDDKYVVFKRDEFNEWLDGDRKDRDLPRYLDDAVVIRRQDVFAAPALDAYANCISAAVQVMKLGGTEYSNGQARRLQNVADYFQAQAEAAREVLPKIPD